jgi:non-heme chloroperoxidase
MMVNYTATPLLTHASVTLANGVRLHYKHKGPAKGRAVILLHGYSDSSGSFSRVMSLLPPDLRVIAPDLRGHGDSAHPVGGYRIHDLAADVIQLLYLLNVPSAIIVGHSMGSFVAQEVAHRAPGRVTGLVLIGSAPVADNDTLKELRAAVDRLTDPVDGDFVREFQYSTVAQPVPAAFMAAAIANSCRMPAAIWKQVLAGLIEYRPAAPRSYVRALVIGGTRDAVFSVGEQVALSRQYPRGRLQLIDGVGHTPHWEQPEAFVEALLDFVR